MTKTLVVCCLAAATVAFGEAAPKWQSVRRTENKAPHPDAEWKIRFREPAEWSLPGWQRRSLSFGNGYFGASEFGGVDVERLQLTDPTFQTQNLRRNSRLGRGNMTDAADLFIEFGHEGAADYLRELDLENALVTVAYRSGGVEYRRENFISYPDKVGVLRLTASRKGSLAFKLRAVVPFLDGDGPRDRTGTVVSSGSDIVLSAKGSHYGVSLSGRFRVLCDGKVETLADGSIAVSGATEATVVYTLATNYRYAPGMIVASADEVAVDESDRSHLFGPDPAGETERRVEDAARLGYEELKRRHVADFRALTGRSSIDVDFDEADMRLSTPELRALGGNSVYLQALYWRLGKYLLASSSRPGTLPGSLQGCWAGPVQHTAWGAGFWHNINVQMDYWGAFSCNMAECFEAYAAFNAAFRPATRDIALEFLRRTNPRGPNEPASDDLWSVGTASWAYRVMGAPGLHSGPGTGGFTTALYVDWYDFTQRRDVLENHCWPVLRGMADFLTRSLVETNGLYLAAFSASPEQRRLDNAQYYHTVGCAFDQQMIQFNNDELVRFAKLLGRENDAVVKRCIERQGRYDPVQIGESGQIKEYREERFYGDFVREKQHRHISQLVGLYPGAIINRRTPDWLAAARRTLDLRGEVTEAWALLHRMCCRARTGEGDAAVRLFGNLMEVKTADTLWSTAHGAHIVDANYAGAAAFAELLLQSHERDENGNFIIDLLPALPSTWSDHGSFRGLCARGGWEVDCEWRKGVPVNVALRRAAGNAPVPLVRFGGKPAQFVIRGS